MNIRHWIAKIKSLKIRSLKVFPISLSKETGIGIVFDRRKRTFSARRFFSTVEKPVKKVFNYSIDTIDSIHKSHIDFLNITVRESNDRHVRGALLYDVDTGIPYCLELTRQNGEKPITIFHEIGHLIDLVGVGTLGQFESENSNGIFSGLLELSKDTPEVRRLNNLLIAGVIQYRGLSLPLPPRTKITIEYLIEPHEIVARSYAQYIVEKSKSQKLYKMLQNRRNDSKFGEQWSTQNFAPLLAEWDNILNSIGWHVKK
jgi:hypothetical protein